MAVYRPASRNSENEEDYIVGSASKKPLTPRQEARDCVLGMFAMGFLPPLVLGSIAFAIIGFSYKWVLIVSLICGVVVVGIPFINSSKSSMTSEDSNEGKDTEDSVEDSKCTKLENQDEGGLVIDYDSLSDDDYALIYNYKDSLPPALVKECDSVEQLVYLIKTTFDLD